MNATAEFTQRVDKRKAGLSPASAPQRVPDYKAMLFPSDSKTREVFRLVAKVAEPMPVLDKIFEHCPAILREEEK
jgi:hypothetical protein